MTSLWRPTQVDTFTKSPSVPTPTSHPSPFPRRLTMSLLFMRVGVWNLFIFIHAFSVGFGPALNIQFLSICEVTKASTLFSVRRPHSPFLHASAHAFGKTDPWRGGLSALLLSTCVSQPWRGWEWADGMEKTGGEDEAVERVKKVIAEGRLQRKWHRERTDDRFFFSSQQSLFYSYTDTYQSSLPVCGYFQSLLRSPLRAHRLAPLFVLSSPYVFLFTCLITSLSTFFNRAVIGEHWAPMIQSHPYS